MKPASLETPWPIGRGRSFRGADIELKVPFSQEWTKIMRLAKAGDGFCVWRVQASIVAYSRIATEASLLIRTNSS